VGKEDEITPPEVAVLMHRKIKGSIIQIIDQAGHLSNMEDSGEFNKQLTGVIGITLRGFGKSDTVVHNLSTK